jgi:hypothetical protein
MRKLWMAGFIAAALLGLSYARQRSGNPADLVLIAGQVLTVDAADTVALIRAPVNVLKDLKCVLTLLKGNIVYRDTQRLP